MINLIIRFVLVSLIMLIAKNLSAADVPPAPSPSSRTNTQAQIVATVVSVNLKHGTITVKVNDEIHTIQVPKTVRISQGRKTLMLKEILPGQTVTLTLVELPGGEVQLAALTVMANNAKLQPAGRKIPTLPPQAPFPHPPNPANVGGVIISPHK